MIDPEGLVQWFDTSDLGIWVGDIDGRCVDANAAMCRLIGDHRTSILGRPLGDFVVSTDRSADIRAQEGQAANQRSRHVDLVCAGPEGATRRCHVTEFALRDEQGAIVGSVGIWCDLTSAGDAPLRLATFSTAPDRRTGDRGQEPKLQHELLREVHRAAKIGTWEASSKERLLWSDETLDLFGVDGASFRGTFDEFYSLIHPDDVERVQHVADFTDSPKAHFKSEYRIIRPDGGLRHIRQTAIVLRDENGKPQGFSGVVQDVSDQVEVEAQLRQAQKMETIGQLSGGVAHDFNNILAAILGAADLLEQDKSYEAELVESIIRSAKRGAELTHRLLAFARKQPLQTTQVDVPNLVQEMAPMIDRLIGQDIRLELDLPGDVWSVEADPAPLEEALLNLAVNARDAIPSGGGITISCRNTVSQISVGDPSQYVEIVVSDTGVGMPEDIRCQAVDPFFTTKPVGKGSGLGLSMVDGFVRQSGGMMNISSTPGSGTDVSILMPKAARQAVRSVVKSDGTTRGTGETILVIEDNEDLAVLFTRQLASLNYQATFAVNRHAAFAEAERAGGFDVVLSDVLLADGERGPSVVEDLLLQYPDMNPIFMTGFASDDDGELFEILGADQVLLRKPFKIEELARVVQRAATASSSRV